MGTDIHLFVERRVSAGMYEQKWESCDTWVKEDGDYQEDATPHFYDQRNYDFFAIIANVRNGHGFAGIKTGEGFIPISEPRGLPADVTEKVRAAYNGDHSHSWLTVAEIMAYDWTRVAQKQGCVTPVQYHKWAIWRRGHGLGPDEYCASRQGPGVVTISEPEMEKLIKGAEVSINNITDFMKALQKLDRSQTMVCWDEPYYRAASEFLGCTLPRLWRLGAPEDVRIVFGFDS